MVEGTQTAEQTAAPATQQAPVNFDAMGAGRLLDDIGDFLGGDTKSKLQQVADAGAQQQTAPVFTQQPAVKTDDGAQQPPNPAAKIEGTIEPEGGEQKPAAEEKKHPIFGSQKKTGASKDAPVIEKPEDIFSLVKTKYGQEVKDIKELPKFFESVDGWRAAAQKHDEVAKLNEQFTQEYKSLPDEIHQAVNAFMEGKDYLTPLAKTTGLDFKKKPEELDSKTLVKHYYPDKFKDEEFADDDKSEILKAHIEFSQDKFKNEKQAFEQKRAVTADQAKKAILAQKAAADSSVKVLRERFPEIEDTYFNNVKSVIEGGPKKMQELFFNNDGTVKPGAAVAITMALYGESDILPELIKKAAVQTETQLNEDRLTKGADGPKPNKGGGQPEQVPAEVKKKLDELKELNGSGGGTFNNRVKS